MGVGSDGICQFDGLVHQFLGRINVADQTDALSLLRLDGLGSQNQFHSIGNAHDASQPLGAAKAGCDAKAHLGLAEFGLFAG